MSANTRRPFFCGNWKLNGSIAESIALASEVRNGVATHREADVVVAPSFTALHAVAKRLEDGPVAVAAQNCHWEDKGAFTGEVSAPQLADVGCKYVILGHSERRQLFGETDKSLALKVPAALDAGLEVILCVGETLEIREAGGHIGHTVGQLDGSLDGVTREQAAGLVVAYEPVWAIGTGKVATPEDAQEMCAAIRERLSAVHGHAAASVRILYGGSVKADNMAAIMAQPDIDGALVGGASLDAGEFVRICRYREQVAET